MKPRFWILAIMLLLARTVNGTHIIGGEMYYVHLGGDEYEIHLELFRDCGPSNTLGTGFDASANIGVFNANGILQFTLSFNQPPEGESIVPAILNNPCLLAPPEACVATITFSGTVTLPAIPGGYILAYQRCCRTPAILNLVAPDDQGITCTVRVADETWDDNSSPHFTEYPPVVLCMGEAMVIDHSAEDPDGDELEYELYTPFTGGSDLDPSPLVPSDPPYTPVTWASGYSAGLPIDSDPAITIDPQSGVMTLTPTLIGSFAVGVKVKEYRNGQLLSEVIRDFKFDVVSCESNTVSAIQDQDPDDLCNGLSVEFINESENASTFFWDFGDPDTDADTSSLEEPQWVYDLGGSYTVTLIANPGWACADTSTAIFHTSQPISPFFQTPPVACIGEVVSIQAQGNFPENIDLSWVIPPGAEAQVLDQQVLPVVFNSVGTHPVTLFASVEDCVESYTDSVTILPFPIADLTSDTHGCLGHVFQFEDLSTAATPLSYLWDLGDGTTSTEQDPVHQYQEAGTYTISLMVNTSSGCIAADSVVKVDQVVVHPLPVAGFRVEPLTVSMIDAQVDIIDASQGAVAWAYEVEDEVHYQSDVHVWLDDAGPVPIQQTVTSVHGCRDSTVMEVLVTDHLFFAPNAFTPNGDGLNDTFAPVVKGARSYELIIFDRFGREVYKTSETEGEWDGEGYTNGIYNYIARIGEYGPFRKEYKGHITLAR